MAKPDRASSCNSESNIIEWTEAETHYFILFYFQNSTLFSLFKSFNVFDYHIFSSLFKAIRITMKKYLKQKTKGIINWLVLDRRQLSHTLHPFILSRHSCQSELIYPHSKCHYPPSLSFFFVLHSSCIILSS